MNGVYLYFVNKHLYFKVGCYWNFKAQAKQIITSSLLIQDTRILSQTLPLCIFALLPVIFSVCFFRSLGQFDRQLWGYLVYLHSQPTQTPWCATLKHSGIVQVCHFLLSKLPWRLLHAAKGDRLTHYQTTNFRLFQTERVCRRQFQT